jgi:hypothetical protein
MSTREIGVHLAGAALFAGAAAWAVQQQAGYVAAAWVCGGGARLPIWLLTAFALILLMTGGWASWQALRGLLADSGANGSDLWRPRHFLSLVALMAALLFLFTILMQASAALFLPGCIG